MVPVLVAVLLHGALGASVPEQWSLFPPSRASCRAIPPALRLCRGVGYERMRVPNLLGHESLREAAQQAAAWVPLVQKRCHADTRRFLCALFAPVCLEDVHEPIRPCRALCEGVRDACAPVMAAFGFPWPDMLDCARFPPEHELCIPAAAGERENGTGSDGEMKECDVCQIREEDDNEIMDGLCQNDFALKLKVKEMVQVEGDTRIVPGPRSRVLHRPGGVSERELRRAPLWIRGGAAGCACPHVSDAGATYLVLGERRGGELVVTSLRRWHRDRDLRRFTRRVHC